MKNKKRIILWAVLDLMLVLVLVLEAFSLMHRLNQRENEQLEWETQKESPEEFSVSPVSEPREKEETTEIEETELSEAETETELSETEPEGEPETETEAEPEPEPGTSEKEESFEDARSWFWGTQRPSKDEVFRKVVEKCGVLDGEIPELGSGLESMIADYSESVSLYVKDLTDHSGVEVKGGRKRKAASLIKLYVMAAVYDQIAKGALEESEEISHLLHEMITVSDNESTNELVRRLSADGTDWEEGSVVVNNYIEKHGYKDTYMGRDVRDYRDVPAKGENYTSVRDCGKILEEIYRGVCVSSQYSRKMLELLKQQERNWKIPAGIGENIYVANKTGELSDVENDVAIIQLTEDKAYILCIMTEEVQDGGTAISHIVDLSRTVYERMAS